MVSPAIYSIGALSRMLGVSPTTLRTWEERYGVVIPERSAGSQRLYSRDHVEQLRFVCWQIEVGLTAADAHRLLAEHLGNGSPLVTDGAVATERRILLIERDPYAADLAEYLLRTEGYGVDATRSATTAAELVHQHHPDLVILDLMIEGGTGLRLCEYFCNEASVLAVSALDQRDAAAAAGAEAFLRKPLELLALLSTVRDLIGTSALTRQSDPIPSP